MASAMFAVNGCTASLRFLVYAAFTLAVAGSASKSKLWGVRVASSEALNPVPAAVRYSMQRSTPKGWAEYGGQTTVAEYLRGQGAGR